MAMVKGIVLDSAERFFFTAVVMEEYQKRPFFLMRRWHTAKALIQRGVVQLKRGINVERGGAQ